MNNLLGQFEWKGPERSEPTQQEIIKDLHQQVLSKQLEIERLREALLKCKGILYWHDLYKCVDEALQTPPDTAERALREFEEQAKAEGFNDRVEAAANHALSIGKELNTVGYVREIRTLKRECVSTTLEVK